MPETLEAPAEVLTADEHCDEKAQAEAERLAGQLRRIADWLEAHPYAAAEFMYARVGRHEQPQVKFYRLSVLRKAFAGQEAEKSRYEGSEVHTLIQDGIKFESWETVKPVQPEEAKVTL